MAVLITRSLVTQSPAPALALLPPRLAMADGPPQIVLDHVSIQGCIEQTQQRMGQCQLEKGMVRSLQRPGLLWLGLSLSSLGVSAAVHTASPVACIGLLAIGTVGVLLSASKLAPLEVEAQRIRRERNLLSNRCSVLSHLDKVPHAKHAPLVVPIPLIDATAAFVMRVAEAEREPDIEMVWRLLRRNPQLRTDFIKETARFVRAKTPQARMMRRSSLERMSVINPQLDPQIVARFRKMLSSDPHKCRIKLDCLERMLERNPNLGVDVVKEVYRFHQRSAGEDRRLMRLEGVNRLLRYRPDVTAHTMRGLTSFIDSSETHEGQDTKMSGVLDLLRIQPAMPDQTLERIYRFVNSGNTLRGRRAKLQGLVAIYQTNPKLPYETLAQVAKFVDSSDSIDGRVGKMEGMTRIFLAQPQTGADDVKRIAAEVNRGNGLKSRLRNMNRVATQFEFEARERRTRETLERMSRSSSDDKIQRHGEGVVIGKVRIPIRDT